MGRGLLLDVGGVVIRTPFELLPLAERRYRLEPGALGPRGPFSPSGDPEFREVEAGRLAERAYWARRAVRSAALLRTKPDTHSFMQALFDLTEDEIVRPELRSLIEDARAAGLPVGLLTNDLLDFHGEAWVERMTIFDAVDFVIDGSVTGTLKPDPDAYGAAVDTIGVPAAEVVFLDDQPTNIAGARTAGLQALLVDVTAPHGAVTDARARLGLDR